MTSIRVASPAKINLFLDVKRSLRPDGYHELVSLFHAINLLDELEVGLAPEGMTLSCDDPRVPTGEGNLVLRAARAFLAETNTSAGLEFRLTKRIPPMAGLGGGSSNAAAALVGLRALHDAPLSDADLERLCARVSSDAPFFVRGGLQLVRGRGERLEPAGAPLDLSIVLAKPEAGSSTPEVYAEFDREGAEALWPHDEALAALREGRFDRLHNSLAAPATRLCPAIEDTARALRDAGARGTLASGSGSAVIGFFGGPDEAAKAAAALPDWLDFVYPGRTLAAGVTIIG